jgi:acyl-coenzyme A thioesterase PaaI-like protein
MDYPPRRHLLRDLRVQVSREGVLCCARAPVVPAVCGAGGAPRVSFLAALVDIAAGRTGVGLAQGGSVLTQDMEVHLLADEGAREICARVNVLRDGRNLISYEIELSDERGRQVARASMTSAKVARSSSVDPAAMRPGDWLELALPGSGLDAPLGSYAGLRESGGDALELELGPEVSNGLGILHGATQAIALEHAAERAAQRSSSASPVVTDLSILFLAPGRRGPFRAHAELLRERDHTALAHARLVDRGDGDALVAVGYAGLELG